MCEVYRMRGPSREGFREGREEMVQFPAGALCIWNYATSRDADHTGIESPLASLTDVGGPTRPPVADQADWASLP